MAMLVAVEGPFKGQRFKLENADIVIGRSFDADIRLDDLSVSRHHARLKLAGGVCTVEDLSSGNGSFLNEKPLTAPTPLKEGDLLRVSDNVFRYAREKAPAVRQVTLVESAAKPEVMETLDVRATMMNLAMDEPEKVDAEALRKAHQRFRTVLEISNAVQTQLDLEKLLHQIMERLFAVFPQADRGFIMLQSEEEDELTCRVARQRGRDKPEAITISRSIIDKAMAGKVAVLSADAMSDRRFAAAMSVMNFGIRSMMCAPVIASDTPLGVIHLDTTRQDRSFTLDDLDLLTGVANQTAFAIANAQMHRRLMLQERMSRDLENARKVQESFLPDRPPEVPGMTFCASYKAALEVGGDFYDFIPLSDGKLGILVGDVAGKGMSAALMMARMTSDARLFALSEKDAAAVVSRLNQKHCASGAEGFVTLIYAILDPATRELTLVNSAHPPPVRRRADGTVDEIQKATNFPVGAVDDAEFEKESFRLEPGDVICLFSDGVTEAMNAEKELYGSERVHAAVARHAAGPAEVMANLLKDVQAHVGDAYQSDDLTIVCFGAR